VKESVIRQAMAAQVFDLDITIQDYADVLNTRFSLTLCVVSS